MSRKKLLTISLILLSSTAIIWLPGVVCAATGQIDKYQAYLAALDYLLRGLGETLRLNVEAFGRFAEKVIELFKIAISG